MKFKDYNKQLHESMIDKVIELFTDRIKSPDDAIEKLLNRNKESGLRLLTKQGFDQKEARFFMTELRNIAARVAKKLNMEFKLDDSNFHGLIFQVAGDNDRKRIQFQQIVTKEVKNNTNRR